MIGGTAEIIGNGLRIDAGQVTRPIGVSVSVPEPPIEGEMSVPMPFLDPSGYNVNCHGASGSTDSVQRYLLAWIVLVTDIRIDQYLKVDKNVLWVTPDVWEQLMVMSNTEWTII